MLNLNSNIRDIALKHKVIQNFPVLVLNMRLRVASLFQVTYIY